MDEPNSLQGTAGFRRCLPGGRRDLVGFSIGVEYGYYAGSADSKLQSDGSGTLQERRNGVSRCGHDSLGFGNANNEVSGSMDCGHETHRGTRRRPEVGLTR
jgi:hypothetical protein